MQMPAAESKQNKSKYLKGGHKGERPLLMKPLASTALKTSGWPWSRGRRGVVEGASCVGSVGKWLVGGEKNVSGVSWGWIFCCRKGWARCWCC